ncbi:NAD(P)-binding protein [Dentipellis sp. KUC8613]|nr:NAD(P)-binding protein [Dentipellis sp. KUC8613]
MEYFPSFPFSERHDVYPEVDPAEQYATGTHKGKVVFLTGSSRGIGEDLAMTYAKKVLDEVKAKILHEAPSADVLVVPTDMVNVIQVEAAVKAGIERFGRLDIVIANAGAGDGFTQSMTEKDPSEWWKVMEVNVRGVYNVAHFTLPYLTKVHWYFLVTTSIGGLLRVANGSPYSVSKAAANMFVEYITLEFPEVKTFALNPGLVDTEMTRGTRFVPEDNVQILSVNWDIGEIQRDWKDKILD